MMVKKNWPCGVWEGVWKTVWEVWSGVKVRPIKNGGNDRCDELHVKEGETEETEVQSGSISDKRLMALLFPMNVPLGEMGHQPEWVQLEETHIAAQIKRKREEEDLLLLQAKNCRIWERNQWWLDRESCRSLATYQQALEDGMKEGGNEDQERMRWWFERHYIRAKFWPDWRPVFGRCPDDGLYWEEFEEERCSIIELHDKLKRPRNARGKNKRAKIGEGGL
jgi:hypothetical protein